MDKFEQIWIFTLLSGILTFFSPISLIIHTIIIAVIVDCLTAIIRDFKNHPEIKGLLKMKLIRSNKLRKTILKLIFYTLFTMIIYLSEMAIFEQCLKITNFVGFLIIFSELVSIAENLDLITESNKFTAIITKVRKLFEDKINNKIKGSE